MNQRDQEKTRSRCAPGADTSNEPVKRARIASQGATTPPVSTEKIFEKDRTMQDEGFTKEAVEDHSACEDEDIASEAEDSDAEVKAEQKALVEKAEEIATMPEGDEKKEAEKEVIEAAKELEKNTAVTEAAEELEKNNSEEPKDDGDSDAEETTVVPPPLDYFMAQQEKQLAQKTDKISQMPEGDEKKEAEKEVIHEAEKLEKKLVQKAEKIAEMPEGDEKEESEKQVMLEAEELEKIKPKVEQSDSNSDSESDAEEDPEQKQIASVAAKVLHTEQSAVDHNREAIAQMPDGDVKTAAEAGLAVQDKALTSLKQLLRNKDITAVDPEVLGRVGRAEKQQAEAKIQLALAMQRDDGVAQARAEYEEASRVAVAAKLSMLSAQQVS